MLLYCAKCGLMYPGTYNQEVCWICNSICRKVPSQYMGSLNGEISDIVIDKDKEQQFIEERIKNSPDFDQAMWDLREKKLEERKKEFDSKDDAAIISALRAGADPKTAFVNKGQNIPKCPTCGSLQVEKISAGKKVVGGALFGLFSSDVRNTMYCKSCGCKW